MLIRIRCKAGNFRYELQPSSDISELVQKIVQSANADPASITLSDQPRGGERKASELMGRSLQALGLKHGDLLFASYQEAASIGPASSATDTSTLAALYPSVDDVHRPWELVKEDSVDEYWRRQDGKIHRNRDTHLCHHGENAMCDYCMPLEPYDPTYHIEHAIKHLSYHAYLRKLAPPKSKTPTASATLPPLEPLSFKVKSSCPSGNHPPWPAGICSSCQPSAITLRSQPFRMVDHLEFSTHEIVNRFLDVWRRTGTQRFGWLIGRYEPYDKVPMGIKAVVEAIHEPPQEGEIDGLTLGLPWEDEMVVRELAAAASTPLSVVGYIFTDLDPQEEDRTKNVYKRHADSFYLSSLEVIFAARLQLENPINSRVSVTGKFSSRLVTAVATATEDGGIDINAYQVSEQACAMVDADLIEASVDPGTVRVKDEDQSENATRYIPDVFYRYKNEYGLEVQKSAKPCFPVEYLLVNVTHGFPQDPAPLFLSNKFPIENRPGYEDQDIQKVVRDLATYNAPDISTIRDITSEDPIAVWPLVEYLSDWHLVVFFASTGLFSADDTKLLVHAASSVNRLEGFKKLWSSSSWETLMIFTRENAPSSTAAQGTSDDADMGELPQDIRDQIVEIERQAQEAEPSPDVTCPHCTFANTHGGRDCELCGLPLSINR